VAALLLLAFSSYLIDMNVLPRPVFRHAWNGAVLLFSLYLLIRMRVKIVQGAFEKMQEEYRELNERIEKRRHSSLQEQIDELARRISAMEEKA
jgi:hypothetical protein